MYIDPFWLGFVVGAIVGALIVFTFIVIMAITSKK